MAGKTWSPTCAASSTTARGHGKREKWRSKSANSGHATARRKPGPCEAHDEAPGRRRARGPSRPCPLALFRKGGEKPELHGGLPWVLAGREVRVRRGAGGRDGRGPVDNSIREGETS